jgi:hypothetical protein
MKIIFFRNNADIVGMKRNSIFCFVFLLAGAALCSGADLTITVEDLRLVPPVFTDGKTDGYHLYVRKKPDVESILLTESTRDPALIQTNYAYRTQQWNSVNGNELRYLNGALLNDDDSRFSIIDSTPESDEQIGNAFHLLIPAEVVYGNPRTRNGVVQLGPETFVNIRAFGARYGDYTDGFEDNPFIIDFNFSAPPPPPAEVPTALLASFPDPQPTVTEIPIPQSVSTENYNNDAVTS